MSNEQRRPDRTAHYLGMAVSVAARAECCGQKVGAVLVRANRVLSTGYNGAPEGWGNCGDRGVCPRCDLRDDFGSGNAYDKCICVHAEMNAIAAAARYGTAIDGATAYVTHQPCFTCAKELAQAGVTRTYYVIGLPVGDDDPLIDTRLKETQQRLMGQIEAIRFDACRVETGLRVALDQFTAAARTQND